MAAEDSVDVDVDRLSYLGGYADTAESLPLELQRNYTLIRQLDQSAQELMDLVAAESAALTSIQIPLPESDRQQKLARIGTMLNEALKHSEEKFALAKTTYDMVDRHCTRLDNDLQKFEDEQLIGPGRRPTAGSVSSTTTSSNAANTNTGEGNEQNESSSRKKRNRASKHESGGRKKDSRTKRAAEESESREGEYLSTENARQHAQAAISLSDLPIDPNEPVYCYCQQVSFGEMVACDNEECEIEWFHLECVGLRTSPKGKWYCKNCSEQMKGKQKR